MTVDKIKPYAKAVVAFLTPGVVLVLAAMQDSSDGGSVITRTEWITAVLTCVTAAGAVFGVPNKDPLAQHQDESVQPPTEPTVTSEGVAWADPDND
jgi:hypothetical protein